MTVDCKSYSNRRDVSCEIITRPLRRAARAGPDEIIANQALATLTMIAASARENRRLPAAAPSRRRRASAPDRRKGSSYTTGPALAFAAFMIAATTAIAARAEIVSFAPATAVVFADLGMPVNLRGLAIDRVRAAEQQTDDNRELVIAGEIVNLRETETQVPNLRLALRAEDGRELYLWTARGPKERLAAHERVAFKARLAAPPPGVRDVLVKFAAPGDKASFTE
jgi:hypothetical protein